MEVALARRQGYYYEKEESSRHPPLTPSSSSSSSFWVSPLGFRVPSPPVEREHMFNKVVTPSDVGKLNRLVIPKQHAEKHFPLDPSSESKVLLLCFEEGITGKPWRFRYSYWNSSQSYVMTKGWSRFVKEKNLAAGDTVSFARGIGGRLFIDWTSRPPKPRRLPLPILHPMMPLRSVVVPWGGVGLPMVHDSVPVVGGKAAKRVRLFGVTLECSEPDKEHREPGGFSSQRFVQPRGELEPCVELGL